MICAAVLALALVVFAHANTTQTLVAAVGSAGYSPAAAFTPQGYPAAPAFGIGQGYS